MIKQSYSLYIFTHIERTAQNYSSILQLGYILCALLSYFFIRFLSKLPTQVTNATTKRNRNNETYEIREDIPKRKWLSFWHQPTRREGPTQFQKFGGTLVLSLICTQKLPLRFPKQGATFGKCQKR